MKYVIILGDGMADYPVRELGNKTPLMAAKTPAMDFIAASGCTGQIQTIEDDMPTGSAVANLTVLGYDPRKTFQGRGVLEAASLGVVLSETDLALRVNLIHVKKENIYSHSAGHISNEEAGQLIHDLQNHFKDWDVTFTSGLSYRHLLVISGGDQNVECAPPHDHIGKPWKTLLVKAVQPRGGETADLLNNLIRESHEFLSDHPVNQKRILQGKEPANMLWPWSPGKNPRMKTFQERFGIRGATISAVDLIKGLAIYAGLDVLDVEGATGLYDTNYEGKAEACLAALDNHDFVYLHVEAPDEAGHEGNLELKIQCIEDLDKRLIQLVLDGLDESMDETVIAVLPDHATPVSLRCHTRDAVPVAIWDPRVKADHVRIYNEESVREGNLGLLKGDAFIRTFIRGIIE